MPMSNSSLTSWTVYKFDLCFESTIPLRMRMVTVLEATIKDRFHHLEGHVRTNMEDRGFHHNRRYDVPEPMDNISK